MTEKEGFLERWSGRKRASPEADQPAEPAVAASQPEEQPLTDEALAALPPVDEARSAADLRAYLRRGVPEALRRAALRRIWTLNPAIRDYLDPARDYAWDFNAPTSGQGPLAAGDAMRLAKAFLAPGDAKPAEPFLPPVETPEPGPVCAQDRTAEPGASPPAAPPDPSCQDEGCGRSAPRHGGAVPRFT